jgi:cobalt-zinc-cadmium efflux system outer membrane protein
MCIRFLSFLVVLFALGVPGCTEHSNEVALPERRSLGREFSTFQPPAKPMETPDVPEIAEPTGVITLRQALALTLMHNPELKTFSWDIKAAEAGRLQASLRPNPSLDVASQDIGGSGNYSGFDRAENTIAIAQPIEMGQKRAKRTTLASLEKELAEWDYKAKRLDVTREVTEAFIAVLASQERLALTQELVRIAEQAHSTVAQRVEAGRDSPIEQTKSGVALATARIEPQRARRTLESTRKRLTAAWGGRVAGFDAVAGELGEISPVPSSDELSRLVSQNPDVARWEVEKKRRRAALELEKARAVSNVTLIGGLRWFSETDDSTAVLGLLIPLPVSDRNQGGILKATYLLAKTQESGKAAEIQVLVSLEEAAQRLAGTYAEATALKNDVLPGAQSSFDAVSEGYRDGKFDYLQVLDAQRTLFEAKARYIDVITSYHTAKADVERLIGRSIDSITISKSED